MKESAHPGTAVAGSRINREGLPAGSQAPNFVLPDLSGNRRALAEFRGKRVLLVFSDPECGPCQALTPELVELDRRRRDDSLEVLMISRGGVEANRTKAEAQGITFPVVLQRRWEISKEYAMFATPAGYLLDEEGRIAKQVAVGPEDILRLVDASPGGARVEAPTVVVGGRPAGLDEIEAIMRKLDDFRSALPEQERKLLDATLRVRVAPQAGEPASPPRTS